MVQARPLVIAANWKMHKLRGEAMEYVAELDAWIEEHLGEGVPGLQVIVAPPFTNIELVAEQNPSFRVYAQNMHQSDAGAFTGEVSPAMLRDVGAHGVVLGHSERRTYFGETDEALEEKVNAAFEFGLRPMLCVGETIEERRGGRAEQVVERQLRIALSGVDSDAPVDRMTIAYEPVWAIGTGETATPELAQQMHGFIRSVLRDVLGTGPADRMPLLYGGSVKPSNAAELLAQPDIDGALVGGAALDVESFAGIIHAAADQLSGVAR